MLPWSVIPMAGWPSAAAAPTTSAIRAAPSSIEYSVCTWRCVKLSATRAHLLACRATVSAVDFHRTSTGLVHSLWMNHTGVIWTVAPRSSPEPRGGPARSAVLRGVDARELGPSASMAASSPGRSAARAGAGRRPRRRVGEVAAAPARRTARGTPRRPRGLSRAARRPTVRVTVVRARRGRRCGRPPPSSRPRSRSTAAPRRAPSAVNGAGREVERDEENSVW